MLLKQTLAIASLAAALWAQAPAANPEKVVATVGGRDITAADVEKMLSVLNTQQVKNFQQNPQYVLSQYFLLIHLAEEGDKLNLLEKSPYKEQFEQLKIQVLYNARINEENNGYPVTSEMIDSYYKQHSAQWEQAKIKVISLVYAGQPAPTGTDVAAMQAALKDALAAAHAKRSEAEARTLAADIVKQLRGGADFAKLVEQYSDDATSKSVGGDFPLIKSTSEFPAELKSAVFAMKPGEISEPIRQPTAYYIVRLEEKGTQPIDDLRETITLAIRNEHVNQWMKDTNANAQAVLKDLDYFKSSGVTVAPPSQVAPPPQ